MKDNSGKVLLALLAGASAGVIAGLLMAPDTGEVTRGSVKKWAGKLSQDLEKNLQAGLDEIKNMSGTFGKTGGGDNGGDSSGNTGGNKGGSGSTGGSSAGNTGTGSAGGTTGGNATGGNA
ncbi:YtxH domain-containing protein [uncultured Pontibacter sp.]|uniref:YtxH domain-containing protein n=1 Tax=uncultured Pontibacter sp. TaxID=453356 RepID=UPI002616DFBA|nr:YtxH domain-containing protein [uncultured Pontibacter sp.]